MGAAKPDARPLSPSATTENQGTQVTEISFKGKEFVYNHHLSVPVRPLVPQAGKSIGNPALDGNLIIHGDNLHALKALLPLYASKIDCVFIDPPYNTGNEGWSYNDNVNAPMIREWLDANPIGIEDGLRHDKWCAMMWPRLRLLYELLADTGSFWMTLDDNEVHRARHILDEIFGEDCFVANVVWQKRTSPESRVSLGSAHDNIVVYSKRPNSYEFSKLRLTEEQTNAFSNPDDDPRGAWVSTDLTAQGYRPNQMYQIRTPTGAKYLPPTGRCWSLTEPEFDRLQREGRIWFGVDGSARPRVKTYLSESEGVSAWTWWENRDVGDNQSAKKEIMRIMGADGDFEYPKPTSLVARVLDIATKSDAIVLDSFAGSGATAHAVLEANRRDDGARRFVLVEMEDYADRLTAERVRRVAKGYDFKGNHKTEILREKITWTKLRRFDKLMEEITKIEDLRRHEFGSIKKTIKNGELIVTGETAVTERVDGLGGSFTYCTLGQPIELDRILSGATLPSYDALGAVLFHMATNEVLEPAQTRQDDFYLGQASDRHVWLVYRPDLDWLKSPEAALTLSLAKKVAKTEEDARHLVFAPARYVSQKMLVAQHLPVEFAPLPFALYRIDRT